MVYIMQSLTLKWFVCVCARNEWVPFINTLSFSVAIQCRNTTVSCLFLTFNFLEACLPLLFQCVCGCSKSLYIYIYIYCILCFLHWFSGQLLTPITPIVLFLVTFSTSRSWNMHVFPNVHPCHQCHKYNVSYLLCIILKGSNMHVSNPISLLPFPYLLHSVLQHKVFYAVCIAHFGFWQSCWFILLFQCLFICSLFSRTHVPNSFKHIYAPAVPYD